MIVFFGNILKNCYKGFLLGADTVCFMVRPFSMAIKKGDTPITQSIALKVLEAASGFEPLNHGFADQCLSRLATPPEDALLNIRPTLYHSLSF